MEPPPVSLRGAVAGAALAAGPRLLSAGSRDPRVVIVGAGLAGIRTAHALWVGHDGHRGGIPSTVFEADTTHVGGRCWSLRGFFHDGLIGEHGGAFINPTQHWISATSRRRSDCAWSSCTAERFRTGKESTGSTAHRTRYPRPRRTGSDVGRDAFRAALHQAPWPQLWERHTAAGRHLDGSRSRNGWTSMASARRPVRPPDEIDGRLGVRRGPDEQSSYNLISLLAPGTALELPGYDETLHIVGGNDQFVTGMCRSSPPARSEQGHQLVAVAERSDGSYRLTFDLGHRRTRRARRPGGAGAAVHHASRRRPVSRGHLVATKAATRSGTWGWDRTPRSTSRSPARPGRSSATTAPPTPTGTASASPGTTRCSCGPNGKPAILLGFPGGSTGRDTLTRRSARPGPGGRRGWFLNQIEPIFPGTTAPRRARPTRTTGPSTRGTGAPTPTTGSASTPSSPVRGSREGRIHFAGEHTDVDQQGFLDGAVLSGQRVAKEIHRHP